MANILDFNRFRPPILPVKLLDEAGTILHVTPPTVELQEELRVHMPYLDSLLDEGSDEQRTAMWDLAARLMSCNRNWLAVDATQLRTEYGLDEEDLTVFYNAYVDFVKELEHAKN